MEIRKISALLRYYFKIDPDTLDDDMFAKMWNDLKYCLKIEADRYQMTAGT